MNSRYKITAVIFLMGLFGASMYYAGQQEGLAIVQQVKTGVALEKAVIKPVEKKRSVEDAGRIENPPGLRYTFFEVLDDPDMNSYVDLEGKVVRSSLKIQQRPALEKPTKVSIPHAHKQKVPKKPAVLPEKKEEPPRKVPVSKTIAALSAVAALSTEPDHWVQVASFRESGRAHLLEKEFRKKGFPAFVKSRSVPEKGTWYRVYLGSYKSRKDAEQAAGKMTGDTRWKPMIVRPN